MESRKGAGKEVFAVVESATEENASMKAREIWEDIDGIFLREIPRHFEIPATMIEKLVEEDVAQSIMKRSSTAEDDWWTDIPLDPK